MMYEKNVYIGAEDGGQRAMEGGLLLEDLS